MRRFPPWAWSTLFYLAITFALTYPLCARLGSFVAHDAGDPVLNTWILWWSTQKVPFTAAWWNAPIFYPMTSALALSELLVALLPISAPVQWITGNPLAAYNVAFLASFPLCALAAYALAYELTGHRVAAFAAGTAFAFAPYRMSQLAHVQMLSYYWAPLALLGLHRYVRTRSPGMLVLFGAAWLMQALANGYAMFHLSVFIVLWIVWFARDRRAATAIVGVWTVAAALMLPALLVYRRVHADLHLVRDINEIKKNGADLGDIFSAPSELALWGKSLPAMNAETAIFPGVTVLLVGALWLASEWRRGTFRESDRTPDRRWFLVASVVAGLVAFSTMTIGPWRVGPLTVSDFHKPFSIAVACRLLASMRSSWMRRIWRERSVVGFYLIAMVAAYLLALGPEPRLFGRPMLYEPPYAWLMRIPGFDALRVPARFAMVAVLWQSMLLAFVIARSSWLRTPVLARFVVAGLLADGWIRLPVERAPEAGPRWSNVAAVAELPVGEPGVDFGAMYRSMFHGQPVANGFSGFFPPHYLPLTYAIAHGRYDALNEIAASGALGVAINRAHAGAAAAGEALRQLPVIEDGPDDDRWTTFVLPRSAREPVTRGPAIPIARVTASHHPEDAGRVLDRSVTTAWISGNDQIGNEELIVDLGSPYDTASIVLEMGAYAFFFPRMLAIDASMDATTWTAVWQGETVLQTVRAAIVEPNLVPVTLAFAPVSARYLRLRQTGAEPGIPWVVADLEVRAPAIGSER